MLSLRDRHERIVVELSILKNESLSAYFYYKIACLQHDINNMRKTGAELVAIRESTVAVMEERIKLLSQIEIIDRAMNCNNYLNISF